MRNRYILEESREKRVLQLAVDTAKVLLESGAESYRVQATIDRICRAYDIEFVEVLAMPTGLFISLENEESSSGTHTFVKRITKSKTNLTKITKINAFSRHIRDKNISIEEAMEIVAEIDKIGRYPIWANIIGAGLVALGFCMLNGGNFISAPLAMVVGALALCISILMAMLDVNFFISNVVACFVAAMLALILAKNIESASYAPIIIGCLIPYVPGIAFTNSIRDFFFGDTLSGVVKMAEALITGASLATGTGVALALWHFTGGFGLWQ